MGGRGMAGQTGFFDAEERLRWLSVSGDPLDRLRAVVEFEAFRAELEAALPRADHSRGGRPPYDAVLMLRILVLQALYTLSDEQTEYQLRDRLSFMRFVGLALHDAVPDAKTIWLYREHLTRAGALARLFARFDAMFDAMLAERGFLAMGGQIVDATVVEARRPRLTVSFKRPAIHANDRPYTEFQTVPLAASPTPPETAASGPTASSTQAAARPGSPRRCPAPAA